MKKFRPFWSYRIEETETWLEEIGRGGYRLKRLQPFFPLFTFERVNTQPRRYLIDYKSPKGLYEEGGWQQVTQAGQWAVYEGETPTRFSSKEHVLQRFRFHYTVATVLLIVVFFLLNTAVPIFMALHIESFQLTAYLAVFLLLFALFMCASLSLNKWYHTKEMAYLQIQPKVASRAIRKRRIGWMYVQFLTKRWLERLFAQGYELTYVKGMSFYFKPREAAHISYEIINEKPKNTAALLFYRESGWDAKHLYSSPMWHISIWSKSYGEGEVKPQITYAREERLKSLRRGLFNTNVLSILFIFIMSMNILNTANQLQHAQGSTPYLLVLLILSSILLLFWLWVCMQSVYGYIQEKKAA